MRSRILPASDIASSARSSLATARRLAACAIGCLGCAVGECALAAGPDAPQNAPPDAPPSAPADLSQVPWQIVLGARTAQVEHTWPVVDQVVLVPDGRTYLDELSRWSEKGRWPVLIEDGFFAPLFIRGFAPARVIRRSSIGVMPTDRTEREALLRGAVVEAIADGAADMQGAAARRGFTPSMVILADALDPAWTAAAALSAGRCAPISFTAADHGAPGDTLDEARFATLAGEVEDAARASGLPWKGLRDEIDAVLVCDSVALKSTPRLRPELRLEIKDGPMPTRAGEPVATTNALGRGDDGAPWAVASAIFGSEVRSAYAAMSALFASRKSVALVNGYETSGAWAAYDTAPAAKVFGDLGFSVSQWSGEKATIDAWRLFVMDGLECDAFLVNTHGMAFEFGLSGGTKGKGGDVPFFDRPAMVHCIHSFSMQYPEHPGTIAGRFLDHGAYVYHGSVFEPFLSAFVAPRQFAERVACPTPFLVAARIFEGPFARPWRTSGYGDPLALLVLDGRFGAKRIAPADDGATPLRAAAAAALARFRDTKSDAALVEAMRDLELAADDAAILRVWELARRTARAPEAAPFAVGAAFRARDLAKLAGIIAAIPSPDLRQRDMLWQLAMPRIATVADEAVVRELGRAVRDLDPVEDLAALKPVALRVLGREGWERIRAQVESETKDATIRGQIASLR